MKKAPECSPNMAAGPESANRGPTFINGVGSAAGPESANRGWVFDLCAVPGKGIVGSNQLSS